MELMELMENISHGIVSRSLFVFTNSLTVFHTKEIQIKKEEASVQLS